jgi:hypothetical protein
VKPGVTASTCPLSAKGVRFLGPNPLLAYGMRLRAEPGVYVVASGECISHVGASGRLGDRVRTLAHLGTHRGSARVLCAAYCTGQAPQVWWAYTKSVARARAVETELKLDYDRQFLGAYLECDHGGALRNALVDAVGRDTWCAGYVDAIFSIGEHLAYLSRRELAAAWETVGVPPGPWAERLRNFSDS